MKLITDLDRARLVRAGQKLAEDPKTDPVPLLKLLIPDAADTWLVAACEPADPNMLWGLADVGDGEPRLRWFSFKEIAARQGPLGRGLERDFEFRGNARISAYAEAARRAGTILD